MTKFTKDVDWIFFDLDNTLYSWDLVYGVFFKEWRRRKLSRALFAHARAEVKRLLPKGHPSARNRLLYLKTFLDLTHKFSPSETLRLLELYESIVFRETLKQVKTLKRTALLRSLSKKYKLAIVTNENLRTQLLKLKAIDPHFAFFKFLLTSEEAGVEKPKSFIFKQALRMAKTRPSRVLFVGDSIDKDIRPAKRMGFRTLLTQEFAEKTGNKTGLQTLEELRELLL